MKKSLIVITFILAVVLVAAALVGCTESYKQSAVPTEKGAVSDNGGMAVVYGKYLYFINGYAGESADNTFGSVVKGAIARVELENGKPKGNAQVIVSKNVYGTDTTYGGLYIADDYIYFASTNTDLDSTGSAKTASGVLMRAKVDGSSVERIATFDDHSFVFTVVGKKLTYIRNNNVYVIDLTASKLSATTVETGILTGYLLTEDYLYYTQYNDGHSDNYVIKAYPLAGGKAKVILSNANLNADTEYTFSLLSAIDEGNNKVKLFYTKTDSGLNTPEVGVYAYEYVKGTFAFNKANEVRFTHNATSATNLAYTKFYKAGTYYLGLASTKLDIFNADGTRATGDEGLESLNIGSTVSVFEVEETENAVYLWYIDSSVLKRIQILSVNNGVYAIVEKSAKKMFTGSYNTTYVSIDRIGDVLYYLNSSISDNAYYYVLDDAAESTDAGKILGIITETDRIAAF